MSLTERIIAVLDALGIGQANVATQISGDIAALVAGHPGRLAGVALVAPPRVDASKFQALGKRLLYITPDSGTLAKTAVRALPQLPDARTTRLEGYAAESWDDLATDRPDITDILAAHMATFTDADTATGDEQSSETTEIRYRAFGSGPVLLLTPMALSPSQWKPLLPSLAKYFRVVALSGPKLGMLALLEERAALAEMTWPCNRAQKYWMSVAVPARSPCSLCSTQTAPIPSPLSTSAPTYWAKPGLQQTRRKLTSPLSKAAPRSYPSRTIALMRLTPSLCWKNAMQPKPSPS